MKPTVSFRSRPRTILLSVVLLCSCFLAPGRIAAYDVDTHYQWTYYLCLHAGFTERQAYQIASATFAIDHDAQTGPMESGLVDVVFGSDRVFNLSPEQKVALDLTLSLAKSYYNDAPPSIVAQVFGWQVAALWWLVGIEAEDLNVDSGSFTPPIRNVWSNYHAFAESQIVRSGRRPIIGGGPTPEEVRRVGDIQILRELQKKKLWSLGMREGNPGAYMHYAQDWFAHNAYDNVRGHAFHGHWPDFLSAMPGRSQTLTLGSLRDLVRFRCEFLQECAGALEPERKERILSVLAEMIAINPVPPHPIANLDPTSTVGGSAPSRFRAARLLDDAIEDDFATDLLPRVAATDFPSRVGNSMPAEWIQFDFDVDGRVVGHASTSEPEAAKAFAVEQITLKVGEVSVEIEPTDSAGTKFKVDLEFDYTLDGVKNLNHGSAANFLNPLPVYEHCAASDFPAGQSPKLPDRDNGTYTVNSVTLFRSRAALEELVWECTIQAYGLAAQVVSVPLAGRAPPPGADDSDNGNGEGDNEGTSNDESGDSAADTAAEVAGRAGAATNEAQSAAAASEAGCQSGSDLVAQFNERATSVASDLAGMQARLDSLNGRIDRLTDLRQQAAIGASDTDAAARELASLRDRSAALRDSACAQGEAPTNSRARSDVDALAARVPRLLGQAEQGARAAAQAHDLASALEPSLMDVAAELLALEPTMASIRGLLEQAQSRQSNNVAAQSEMARSLQLARSALTLAVESGSADSIGLAQRALGEVQAIVDATKSCWEALALAIQRASTTIETLSRQLAVFRDRAASLRASINGPEVGEIRAADAAADANLALAESFAQSILTRADQAVRCSDREPDPSSSEDGWGTGTFEPGQGTAGNGWDSGGLVEECRTPPALNAVLQSALRRLHSVLGRKDKYAELIDAVNALAAAASQEGVCQADRSRARAVLQQVQGMQRAELDSADDATANALASGRRAQAARDQRWAGISDALTGFLGALGEVATQTAPQGSTDTGWRPPSNTGSTETGKPNGTASAADSSDRCKAMRAQIMSSLQEGNRLRIEGTSAEDSDAFCRKWVVWDRDLKTLVRRAEAAGCAEVVGDRSLLDRTYSPDSCG